MSLTFALTGGGTGGHLAIAKSIAVAINKTKHKAIYIGSQIGQDRDWFEGSTLFTHCYFLDSTGVVNKRGFAKLNALLKQIKAAMQCKSILKAHNVCAVISVGGFSAGGASIGAILGRLPLFIHEQNAIKGRLNALLTPFAKAIFGSFQSDSKHFIRTSYPVRDEFFATRHTRSTIKHLLFLGGSQGAKGINDIAIAIAPRLIERGICIAHQCGTRDLERVKEAYLQLGILDSDALEIFAFESEIIKRINVADICIARSGASSIWEMAANGLVGIFIPYPYAASNHQYHNALYFTQKGLGMLLEESSIDIDLIFNFIDKCDGNVLKEQSLRLMEEIEPQGAECILGHILARLEIKNDSKQGLESTK